MLTPEYLQRITEAAEDAVSKTNTILIDRIARRIEALFEAEGDVRLIPSSVHDVMKLENAGMVQQDIIGELKKRMPELEGEIEKAFLDAADKISAENTTFTKEVIEFEHDNGNLKDITDDDLDQWEKVGLGKNAKKLNMTPKEVRLLEEAYKKTKGTVRNMTATTAREGQNAYIDACDEAYHLAQSGVSMDQAISDAIDSLARKGVTTVSFARRTERMEVAVARAVRTGINQAAGDIVLTRCAEMGVNYVLTSQHYGARVTNADDYTNHSWWQGKVYRLDWNREELSKYMPTDEEIKENEKSYSFFQKVKKFLHKVFKGEYPDFVDTCGYGTIEGICGINCRHSFTQFYPGINKNTQKPIDSDENKKRYALDQEQRRRERKIRELERRLYAQRQGKQTPEKEDKAAAIESQLIQERKDYDDFCKDHHLPRQNWRLKTAKKQGVENDTGEFHKKAENGKNYEDVTEEWLKNATPNSHEVRDIQEYTKDGITYKVDGKHVVLDYSKKERHIAEILKEQIGANIQMMPRVVKPEGISTPDFMIDGEKYDLKVPIGKSDNVLYNMVNKKKQQAPNFVFDISNCPLDEENLIEQASKLFESYHTGFIQNVMIVKDDKIIKILKRRN